MEERAIAVSVTLQYHKEEDSMQHNWKRMLSGLLSALVLTGAVGGVSTGVELASASDNTLTGLTAYEITDQMTIGWNLGNTLECSSTGYSITTASKKFATAWGNPAPTAELFETVQEAGFNTVRIPITWYEHIEWDDTTQSYVIAEAWLEYVQEVVDYAYDLGMFVIINVHHEDWVNVDEFTETTYAEAEQKLTDIWTQVAEVFADYDQHLIFEAMNEPRQTGLGSSVEWGNGDSYSREYINRLNAAFVEVIRNQGSGANAERLLMLPGYCATYDSTAVSAITIPENSGNVAISVHAYAPYFFTMDTSSYANHTYPGKSGYGEDYSTALQSMFSSLKSISDSKGVPIIIGEFGASDFENTESRVAWATDYLTYAKEAGITCILWDNNVSYDGTGEAHGYLYRSTNTWYSNSIAVIEAMMAVYGVECNLTAYQAYEQPDFSWDLVDIGDDWISLYTKTEGNTLSAWGNTKVSGWQTYFNGDYDFVLIYDSETEPYLVLQGGWYTINSSEGSDGLFTVSFTYEDVLYTLESYGITLESMSNLYISASSGSATIYGLYAVPRTSSDTTDSEPEEIYGDVNGDGVCSIVDIVALQHYLLGMEDGVGLDLDEDGVVTVYDLVALRQYLLA